MSEAGAWLVRAFWWSALAVGIPSALGTAGFGLASLVLWWQRPEAGSGTEAKVSDSLVNVVVVMAGWLGKLLGGLLGMAEGLLRIATVVSAAGLVFAALLYLTSRGLAVNAVWARMLAGVLLLGLLAGGLLGSLTQGAGWFRFGGLGVAGASAAAMWTLWRGLA